jgi:hypothetical protein
VERRGGELIIWPEAGYLMSAKPNESELIVWLFNLDEKGYGIVPQ